MAKFSMTARMIRKDRGLEKIVAATNALGGSGVKVGFQANTSVTEGVDALDIAIWNEFGTRSKDGKQHIPPRPMVQNTAIKYQKDAIKVMTHLVQKVQENAPIDQALATLGQWYQGRLQAHIRSGEFKPNKPSTIARKGSSVPLVDEGRHLIPGVRYVVLPKGWAA